jgi:hypothetical protein
MFARRKEHPTIFLVILGLPKLPSAGFYLEIPAHNRDIFSGNQNQHSSWPTFFSKEVSYLQCFFQEIKKML